MVAAKAEAGSMPSSKGSIWLAHRERGQGGLPRISCRSATAQGEPALEASRSAARRGSSLRRGRKHSSPQGAREESRLQKSVRRIFLAANEDRCEAVRGSAGWFEATRRPLTGQPQARSERQGAGRCCAREQQAQRSPPGPQGPGRSDGRRAGLAGGCRSKPTAATADLAWWRCPAAASREGAVAVGGRVRRRGSEPVVTSPSRDRGRQKLARTVRLPQPMGAGGRRPTEAPPDEGGSAPRRYADG